jgi:hypothetical protein
MGSQLLDNPRFIAAAGVFFYAVGVVAFMGGVISLWQNSNPGWFSLLGAVSVCVLFLLKVRAMEVRKMLNSHR